MNDVPLTEAQFRDERERYMKEVFPKREIKIEYVRPMCTCRGFWNSPRPWRPHFHNAEDLKRFRAMCKYK